MLMRPSLSLPHSPFPRKPTVFRRLSLMEILVDNAIKDRNPASPTLYLILESITVRYLDSPYRPPPRLRDLVQNVMSANIQYICRLRGGPGREGWSLGGTIWFLKVERFVFYFPAAFRSTLISRQDSPYSHPSILISSFSSNSSTCGPNGGQAAHLRFVFASVLV
jgi:hypothetical protein